MQHQYQQEGVIRAMAIGRLASVAVVAMSVAITCLGSAWAETKTIAGAKPVSPQPAANQIEPGLAVIYFHNMFQRLNDIGKLGKGVQGKPISLLDHKTNDGNVLTDDRPMGSGAKITGLIKFDAAGKYVFRMISNDGARVTIAGIKLLEDDGVHGDTLSDPVELVVEQPGWYEIKVDYFQKKGTSALQLFWTPPGAAEAVVPAPQYAHFKD